MNSSDYIFSLRALNLWLEDLEKVKTSSNDPEINKVISQVSTSFENVFTKFSEQYKDETGIDPPDNLCELMIYSGSSKEPKATKNLLRREVFLPQDVIELISELVKKYDYTKLKNVFQDIEQPGRFYLNVAEAEALIELVIIEQKKALLKYPNYDKTLESYSLEHENMILTVQQDLYEKVVLSITEAFKEFDRECLI